jgi:hypothetical protein
MRLGFNPSEYTTRTTKNGKGSKYKPVPEGIYSLECLAVSIVVSKAGDKMIKAEFEILDPPADAGHVWAYFLLEHAESWVVDRAREDLAEWAAAAGKPDVQDTDELEHTQCRVKLVIEPGKGDYGPSNKIKFYVVPKGAAEPAPTAKPEPELPLKPAPAKDELADDIPF